MHIEPGLVDSTKIFLSYATAASALLYSGKLALDMLKKEGPVALLLRSAPGGIIELAARTLQGPGKVWIDLAAILQQLPQEP